MLLQIDSGTLAAVLVECVRDVYDVLKKTSEPEHKGNLESGRGIGRAVMDSVAAVLVQCVRDAYDPRENITKGVISIGTIKGHLASGKGIGWPEIKQKEPSLTEHHIRTALKTFRNTGLYSKLLKQGGLPKQFLHLYEKPIVTTIEAVAMFPKPAHAAAWGILSALTL